jgi:hypothetical protein
MGFKKIVGLAVTALALNLIILADANAATISVKCEVRGTSRSKISVDGAGLTGTFYARVTSGVVTKQSKATMIADSSHEVEFDFDSNPNDVKAGATAIPAAFIKSNKVIGYIRRSGTNAIVGAIGATCKAK